MSVIKQQAHAHTNKSRSIVAHPQAPSAERGRKEEGSTLEQG